MQITKKHHRNIGTTTYDRGSFRGIVYMIGKTYSVKVGDRHPTLIGPDNGSQVHGFKTKAKAEEFVTNWLKGAF